MIRCLVLAGLALFGLTGCVVAPARPYYGGGYYSAPAYGYAAPRPYYGGYGYGGYYRRW